MRTLKELYWEFLGDVWHALGRHLAKHKEGEGK